MTRRPPPWLVALALLATACTPTPSAARRTTVAASSSPVAPTPQATPSARVIPASPGPAGAGLASTFPSAAPTAEPEPPMLLRPPGEVVVVSGLASLDAAYLVAQGAGNFIGHNGSAVLAAGGGSFIGHNGSAALSRDMGGSLVAQGAGNLVAQGAGNLVAQGAGNFIGHNGSALIATEHGNIVPSDGLNLVAQGAGNFVLGGGGSLVAQGAGNLVAQGAGNFIGHNGSAYGLLALPRFSLADASPAAVPAGPAAPVADPGQLVPAAGLRIAVLSLVDDTPVALGQDASCHPVYTVYTDLNGHYELYLPPDTAQNVRVVANVRLGADPTRPLDDANPRLRYDVVRPNDGTSGVDDDTQAVSQFLLAGLKGFLQPVLGTEQGTQKLVQDLSRSYDSHTEHPELALALTPLVERLHAQAVASGLTHAPKEVSAAVAGHLLEQVLARTNLEAITIDQATTKWYIPVSTPSESAMDAMRQVMAGARVGTATALQAGGPAFFEAQPYMIKARKDGVIDPAFTITRPADIGEFITDAYLSHGGFLWGNIGKVLASVGKLPLPSEVQAKNYRGETNVDNADRLEAAGTALLQELVKSQLIMTDDAVAYIAAHPYPAPAQVLVPAASCKPRGFTGP